MLRLENFTHLGITPETPEATRRGILLSNQVGLILFGLGWVLLGLYLVYYPINIITYAIPIVSFFCLSTVFLNKIGLTGISRVFISVFVPVAGVGFSVYAKFVTEGSGFDLNYFTYRFVILAAAILPAVIFSTREKFLLYGCLLFNLALLVLYDPIHYLFGVGYSETGLDYRTYQFTNYVIIIAFFVELGALLFLKVNLERADRKNQSLLHESQLTNEILNKQNAEIEQQHHNLKLQSEQIVKKQEQLTQAYQLIEKQKRILEGHNESLEAELIAKNSDLSEANSELIKYNNELRQFSYTISHNLRGPVASLLGLTQLIKPEKLDADTQEIVSHIQESSVRLDNIIRDLNKIIDIRNDIFRIRQKISLSHELEQIKLVLKNEFESDALHVKEDFSQLPFIYSVSPMIHSILYNLISNALKYRAPERILEIRISAKETDDDYTIIVEDNGLGIDLAKNRDNLFKLYKRFHHHTEGKGIGLYLVKLQAEALGGYVHVESELNKFTRFIITLKKPENIERQILLKEKHATIYFDASINAVGVFWYGPLNSKQYRDTFIKCLELVKVFNTVNYVSDITHQGYIDKEDQHWMFSVILPEAISSGLRRVSMIWPGYENRISNEYVQGVRHHLLSLGAAYEIFASLDEATNWMRQENEKELLENSIQDGKITRNR
ncbi:MAG: HAMP domain-containing histidine kinase [Cyclobacteriaceae bacterium]|nr:HAMP domain-containing histidine kinase [Cyclobacteriaceae bacterium]